MQQKPWSTYYHQETSGIGINYSRILLILLVGGSPELLEGCVGVERLAVVLITSLTVSVGLQLMLLPEPQAQDDLSLHSLGHSYKNYS